MEQFLVIMKHLTTGGFQRISSECYFEPLFYHDFPVVPAQHGHTEFALNLFIDASLVCVCLCVCSCFFLSLSVFLSACHELGSIHIYIPSFLPSEFTFHKIKKVRFASSVK